MHAVVAVVALLGVVPLAHAGSTGYQTAATASGGAAWSGSFTVANLSTSDNNRAISVAGTLPDTEGIASSFGLSLPGGASVTGIAVQVEGRTAANKTADFTVELWHATNAAWTASKTGSYDGNKDAVRTLGGIVDGWGETWSASDISSLQVRIYRTGGTADLEVNLIQVEVHYSLANFVSYQEGDGKGSVSETWDVTLDITQPDTNLDGSVICVVDQTDHQHCVLKFPNMFGGGADQIPLGSTILSATLVMYVFDGGTDCPIVYQLTEDWTASEVTWNSRRAGVSWTDPGADGTTSHKAVAEGVIPCVSSGTFQSLDVTTGVQGWSSGEPNAGWIFVNDLNNDGIDFSASEEPTVAWRPRLVVDYVPSVFYSVGTSTADLKTGAPKITISGGRATLDVAQANDIGVGDVIDHAGAGSPVYIWSVVSPTEFRVQTATGDPPTDVSGVDVNSIKRAFNSVAQAITDSSNGTHLNSTDLTATGVGRRLTWVCYDDTAFPLSSPTTLTGYTTDATHFITLTVAGAHQVANGSRQRHTGVAGTGVRFEASAGTVSFLVVEVPYTRIEWVEFDGNDVSTTEGVVLQGVADNSLVRNVILHHLTGTPGDETNTATGVLIEPGNDGSEVWNSVVYAYDGDGVHTSGSNTVVANSTFYLGRTNPSSQSIQTDTGPGVDATVYNVLALGPETDFFENTNSTLDAYNCITTDSSACDFDVSGSCLTGVTEFTEFVSLAGTIDLHLQRGAEANDFGVDLSARFIDDIDGHTRPLASAWDVGSDESGFSGATPQYRSIGTAADLVGSGETLTVTAGSATVTKVGGPGWQAQNRGRGDVLIVNGTDEYMIEGVLSDDELLLASLAATDYTGTTYTIARQYRGGGDGAQAADDWETCIDGGPCTYFPVSSSSLVADGRSEIGIFYADSVFTAPIDTRVVRLSGSTTDATHTITLTADGINRHDGTAGSGVQFTLAAGSTGGDGVEILDRWVTVEWIEFTGDKAGADAIELTDTSPLAGRVVIRNNLIHDVGNGIQLQDALADSEVYNNIIYDVTREGIRLSAAPSSSLILNNTVYNTASEGIYGNPDTYTAVVLQNNIVHTTGLPDYGVPGVNAASSDNLSSDGSATAHSPAGGDIPNAPLTGVGGVNFVETTAGIEDLHIQSTSVALDAGADLSATFASDIDAEGRTGSWDLGADEFNATTAVRLVRFEALPGDASVELAWETASERDNAGFHLHRSLSETGPWERITEPMILGLGSTPVGQEYSFLDTGVVNGTTYFYRLEDIEISGLVTSHGPVSATPRAAVDGGEEGEEESGAGPSEPGGVPTAPPEGEGWMAHGDPADLSLTEISRTASSVTFELRTGGFFALTLDDGTTRLAIPGFMDLTEPGLPLVPTRRLWTPAVVGRQVRLAAVQTFDVVSFDGLQLPLAGAPTLEERPDGTPRRASFRPVRAVSLGRGSWPRRSARVLQTAFQGEEKKAYIELAPLTLDAASGRLDLARRMLVQITFDGVVPEETGSGSRGRRVPTDLAPAVDGEVLLRFATSQRGVYAVRFEDAFGADSPVRSTSQLRLSRRGVETAFAVGPEPHVFGPGSVLYFFSEGAEDTYAGEAVYELVASTEGTSTRRRVHSGVTEEAWFSADGRRTPRRAAPALAYVRASGSWEQNGSYFSGLLEARDPWLWDRYSIRPTGPSRDFLFELGSPASVAENAHLVVELQGVKDGLDPLDHHILVSLNGAFLGETRFDGQVPHAIELSVPSALLVHGTNTLTLERGADAASLSMVQLDRFSLVSPAQLVPRGGILDGEAPATGTVFIPGFGAGALLLDTTGGQVRFLRTPGRGSDDLAFSARAGHHYVAAASEALLPCSPTEGSPCQIRESVPQSIRDTSNQADWILVTPRAFLDAAQPLVAHRQGQGLSARAVALEDVYAAFSHGETDPQALQDFLSYAFHSWASPSPRYVLLLGEATYDPRGYVAHPLRHNILPAPQIRSPFQWTPSDLVYAAVNGDDAVPDIAIGRLTANDATEARDAVQKILDFEGSGYDFSTNATLVADAYDPRAGDFTANVTDIASLMTSRPAVEVILDDDPDVDPKAELLAALNDGTSVLSYVGHGSYFLWGNYGHILIDTEVDSLLAQPRQPLLLTMTCSTGYFTAYHRNSITEAFVHARGRGAIAAFSPTSESYNDAAHQFHRAVVQRLESGAYDRLGDVILQAQIDYFNLGDGAYPPLLSLYHLFGDPGLVISSTP